jgi:hypothetical protein
MEHTVRLQIRSIRNNKVKYIQKKFISDDFKIEEWVGSIPIPRGYRFAGKWTGITKLN